MTKKQKINQSIGNSIRLKKDRSKKVQRNGIVASEITKNGGIAICAPIAPSVS